MIFVYLKRKIDSFLSEWKACQDRNPLVIKGARQIGKTESIRHFAEENYENFIEIDFSLSEKFSRITDDGYDVEPIIKNITLIDPSVEFIPGKTLLYFDNIQDDPNITTALKSFKINGRFDVICSGSLLGINYKEIENNSVGYKTDYTMYSLDFEEFLWAKGYKQNMIDDMLCHIKETKPFSELQHKVLSSLFFDYSVLGGMPAVVKEYIENNVFTGTLDIQRQLMNDYKEDIRKYAQGLEQTKIISVFNSIPAQLAKENKKFQCI